MILHLGKSIKKLNKFLNIDLKSFANWLNASNISLNVKKTVMVTFKSKRKKFNDNKNKVKWHTWQHHINDLSVKLIRVKCFTT